jgi:hypothetical protein
MLDVEGRRSSIFQYFRRRLSAISGGLPQMIAPLIAPVDAPITQSIFTPCSTNAW